jgi:hypothetical protein
LDRVVITGGQEGQDAALGAENQANVQPGPALEIISTKSPNAKAGMKMRFAKSIVDRIDGLGDFTATRFRKLPTIAPEGF